MSSVVPGNLPVIRAVCFDLDGLMFNTEHVFYESAVILLARRDKPMTRAVMNVMLGRRPLESFQSLVDHLNLKEDPADLLAESRDIFQGILETKLEPMPGLFELLERIEAIRLPKGVATSSPREYLDNIFARFHLSERFPTKLTSESVTFGKPHPEIYLKAAELMGVAPNEMLVLEDTQTGTRAGAAAGAFVVSVPHEHTADHDFSLSSYVASSLADPFIDKLLARATIL